MRKPIKVIGISLGIIVLLGSILFINWFVYPFSSANPNYNDVERVFNKMQFPSDWKEISASENRGIAGRACPVESETACFHKNKKLTITSNSTIKDAENVLNSAGCGAVSVQENFSETQKNKFVLRCSTESLTIGADYVDGEYFSVTVYSS